jgi:hypothetical protein
VTTPLERFAFVDSVIAAEVLHVTQDAVLDWVKVGKLRAVGGKPSNPFLRSADVAALVRELGVQADEPPRRTRSASAKVQARLTADARWSDITEEDIQDWAVRADPARRQAARQAATHARAMLEAVLRAVDEFH